MRYTMPTVPIAVAYALTDAIQAATSQPVGYSAAAMGTTRQSLARARKDGLSVKRAACLLGSFNLNWPGWVSLRIEISRPGHELVRWFVVHPNGDHQQGEVRIEA